MNIVKTVLLVEDDIDDQYFFCNALKLIHPKISCVVANNGVEALKLLNEIQPFDLIFMDLNMPMMNGFECIKNIKASENSKHIPVIIMSTSKRPRDIEMCNQLGALGYFTKSSNFDELFTKIEALISQVKNGNPYTFIQTG